MSRSNSYALYIWLHEAKNLSVYGKISRAHLFEVFVYRAYRSWKLFRDLGIAQARHAVIERKTHVFRKVKGSHDLVCAWIVLFFVCLIFIFGFLFFACDFKALAFTENSVIPCLCQAHATVPNEFQNYFWININIWALNIIRNRKYFRKIKYHHVRHTWDKMS